MKLNISLSAKPDTYKALKAKSEELTAQLNEVYAQMREVKAAKGNAHVGAVIAAIKEAGFTTKKSLGAYEIITNIKKSKDSAFKGIYMLPEHGNFRGRAPSFALKTQYMDASTKSVRTKTAKVLKAPENPTPASVKAIISKLITAGRAAAKKVRITEYSPKRTTR